MPCFNVADVVGRTIISVCSQTFTSFELIMVDDGSSDETVQVIRDATAENLPAGAEFRILFQANRGAGAARNRGMSEARGDLIAFLDADDLWQPEYLATAAAAFEEFPELEALASNSWDQLPNARQRLNIQPGGGGVLIIEDFFEASSKQSIVLRTSGVTVRRSVVGRVGGMREDLIRAQDTEYWARLAASGVRWGFSLEPLVIYNGVRLESLSRNESRFANAPSPETWSSEIWPLLDPRGAKSFRKWYLDYARSWCRLELQVGLDERAKATAREALPRAAGWRNTLFLLAASYLPGELYRFVWRTGAPVKRLLLKALKARPTGRLKPPSRADEDSMA